MVTLLSCCVWHLRGVTSEGGHVDHEQHLAGVLGGGEGDVGQPLDVLAGVVVEAPGVSALWVTVLVLVLGAPPGTLKLLVKRGLSTNCAQYLKFPFNKIMYKRHIFTLQFIEYLDGRQIYHAQPVPRKASILP